jgi:hypothetical protein
VASAGQFKETMQVVRAFTPRQVCRLLDAMAQDPEAKGLRAWLGGEDPMVEGAGSLLTQAEAAAVLDVERQRVWRWEKQGKIARVATKNSGPLYLRSDVVALGASGVTAQRRSRGEAREARETT